MFRWWNRLWRGNSCLPPLSFRKSRVLHKWWGGPPGPRGFPRTRSSPEESSAYDPRQAGQGAGCGTGSIAAQLSGMGHECPRHFAAAFLAAALAAGLSAQTVFRADVSLVRVTATARNRVGQLVGTLAKEDFEIFDNGVRQEIAVFERRSEQPLSVAVLIDVSGSTAKDIKYETDSAAKFLRALLREGNPEDRVALYSFDDSVRLIQDFTHNYTLLEAQLRKVHGSAGTSLYDAIWLASTEGLEAREGRKVIVVVSDGGETTSIKDSHQALAAAQMADATMYPVVDVPITNDAGRNVGGENALTFMAQGTGGRTFLPATAAELDSAFASIINDLRTSYLLGYYPRGVPLTKERFHKLELRAKIPGLQVSARNGYYGDAIASAGSGGGRVSTEPLVKKK